MAITPEIQQIAELIRQAVPAERIYLFGSHAYGTPHKHSDYDFYVVIPDGSMRPIEAAQRAQRALIPLKGIGPVDIVAGTQSKFEIMRGRIGAVEKDVAAKGVVVYERHSLDQQVA